jgi:hypothetical protein
LKQIIQLPKAGQSIKAIARLTGVARKTVRTYLARSNDAEFDIVTQSDNEPSGALYNHDTTLLKVPAINDFMLVLKGLKNNLFHLAYPESCCGECIWIDAPMVTPLFNMVFPVVISR